mgnify:CR=1 FL=1
MGRFAPHYRSFYNAISKELIKKKLSNKKKASSIKELS